MRSLGILLESLGGAVWARLAQTVCWGWLGLAWLNWAWLGLLGFTGFGLAVLASWLGFFCHDSVMIPSNA